MKTNSVYLLLGCNIYAFLKQEIIIKKISIKLLNFKFITLLHESSQAKPERIKYGKIIFYLEKKMQLIQT